MAQGTAPPITAKADEQRPAPGTDGDGRSEWAWAKAIRSGDRAAATELYRAHHGSIRHFLARFTGSTGIADDLAQETFVRAFAVMDEYRGRGSLKAWLFGIARNLGLAWFRDGVPIEDLAQRQRIAPQASPEASAEVNQAIAALERIMSELPREQQEAFHLRVIEQLPIEDVATILDVAISTVTYRVQRAQAYLQRRYQEATCNTKRSSG